MTDYLLTNELIRTLHSGKYEDDTLVKEIRITIYGKGEPSATDWLDYLLHLPIYDKESLPNSKKKIDIAGQNFAKALNERKNITQRFGKLAKSANFRQIWSHCVGLTKTLPRTA